MDNSADKPIKTVFNKIAELLKSDSEDKAIHITDAISKIFADKLGESAKIYNLITTVDKFNTLVVGYSEEHNAWTLVSYNPKHSCCSGYRYAPGLMEWDWLVYCVNASNLFDAVNRFDSTYNLKFRVFSKSEVGENIMTEMWGYSK